MAKGCRDAFALDSFSDFRSLWFVWCSAGIDGHGRPLDLKGSPLLRRDMCRLARLRLRGGRSQIAERDKGLKEVTENATFKAFLRQVGLWPSGRIRKLRPIQWYQSVPPHRGRYFR
jgi:hypothetical protein